MEEGRKLKKKMRVRYREMRKIGGMAECLLERVEKRINKTAQRWTVMESKEFKK